MSHCRILLLWLILGSIFPISTARAYSFPARYDKAYTLYKEGMALKKEGHLQEARRCFVAAIACQQDFSAAHLELGHVYLLLHQPMAAREHYQQVLYQEPLQSAAFRGLAYASYALGEFALVPGYCEAALPSGDVALWLLTGQSYFELGRYEEALVVLTMAAKQPAADAVVYRYLGMTSLQLGDPASGIRELQTAYRLAPCDTSVLFTLAHACYDQGSYRQAVMYWQELLSIVPRHAFAAYMLGKSYLGAGEAELGQLWCERAFE